MPIEVRIWKLGDQLSSVGYSRMESERRLEGVLACDVTVIDADLLLIGRQVPTAYGKFIDLLALDSAGRIVVIELKRDRTPREVVAQLLDYGSWVGSLEEDEIGDIFEAFIDKCHPEQQGTSLDDAFRERFGGDGLPDTLNESHQLVLVASELDDSSERIINYLADEYGVAINAVFFRVFRDGVNEYLSRAWLTDPDRVEEKVDKRRRLPWNGEFYATFGDGHQRVWEEARKYGFVSAGGGAWYSRTLVQLQLGGRVWVNISGGRGYVGVGTIESEAIPIEEFMVDDGTGKQVPFASLPLKGDYHREEGKQDPDKAESFVKIRWIKALPLDQAVREKGLFGSQHSAARPRTEKWIHTVERLKQKFCIR